MPVQRREIQGILISMWIWKPKTIKKKKKKLAILATSPFSHKVTEFLHGDPVILTSMKFPFSVEYD